MYRLSRLVLVLLMFSGVLSAQEGGESPHGVDFKIDCRACHGTDSWEVDFEKVVFNHDTLSFPLLGQHRTTDCKSCHVSPIFSEAKKECASCHLDVHQQSLGTDCAFCHNSESWIVTDIMGMHERVSFPLLGAHASAHCSQCHISDTELRFEARGTDCFSCHQVDFNNAKSPDHVGGDFSKDCIECHRVDGSSWNDADFNHDQFPLTKAHDIADCAACHDVNNYSNISSDCFSCHQKDYENTSSPSHKSIQIGTMCTDCHTTDPGWTPAEFRVHDNQFFPIYSGAHQGEWADCVDCHVGGNYSTFDCLSCHTNPETDNEHQGVNGYAYNSPACLACHPTGSKDEIFDHNATSFALTGAHAMTDCIACHASGFEGTSTQCVDCHQQDYDASLNPKHTEINLPTDCAMCHTTIPDWRPASFPIHDDYYPLNGAHAAFADDCAACHNGDYNNTPNTCVGCHQRDYDQTLDPNHGILRFSTECTDCHNEMAWVPSTFDHDNQFFPIYSGAHLGKWSNCVDCHTTPGDYSRFTCTSCHMNPETDDKHTGVQGYVYNDQACLACHPTGSADVIFDHNQTSFPLTGAHLSASCDQCHAGGYQGTPTDCQSCHLADYQGSVNPNHSALGLSTDCAQCHTTDPGWTPATFDVHNNYYPLNGAHALIRSDCAQCHNGDYNNTPTDCAGCHIQDYNATSDPPHRTLMFSEDCATCHTEDTWVPSTFDHDGLYFPIYSGKHLGKWTDCVDCHNNLSNYAQFTCVTCHMNPETDDVHKGVSGYIYQSDACLACHPTGDADMIFDHNTTMFPLTGAHAMTDCIACHGAGYMGTPTECQACHQMDYDQTLNPSHSALGLSTDCASCHTTDPGWSPALFADHDSYYPLNGAHALIRSDCAQCHNGDYNNTPNDCVGCHQMDYDQTSTPSHASAQFSTDCASCHTEDAWVPSTFDHDGLYFPINSGTHAGVWNECMDCHTNPMNYSEFSCIGCHEHNQMDMDDKHQGVNGYSYNSMACFVCHPTGRKDEGFDHGTTSFPLTGAHLLVPCLDCHMNGYMGTPTDCNACHQMDYEQTVNPSHVNLGLPTTCDDCHTTDLGWAPATFDIHDNYYALTGAHDLVRNDCAQCHNGDYNNTPNTCSGCHMTDYNGSTNPSHVNLGLPTTCDNCHTTDPGWTPATFDIHDNYYPLTGAHNLIRHDCAQCHNGDYNNTPNTCSGCHMTDYNGSVNPNHVNLGLPTTCDNCHTTDPGWSPATFDIHDNYYPLTGAHNLIRHDCAQCHNGDYNNTPNTCSGCHMTDYNGSTNPSHRNLGLPTTCDNCHTTDPGWAPATFDIHDNYYVLIGAHNLIRDNCAQCHNGDYNNTPNTCFGCHAADYNATTNPNHAGAGFPTSCDDCHSQVSWVPSTFNHDGMYFPIYSGKHDGEWNRCTDCHTTPGNFSLFSCIDCHEHNNRAEVDADHDRVSGYSYNSMACFNCHPDGRK